MNITIKDKTYRFVCNYQNDEVLRKSFNELTNKIWEFDFETWFQTGYWSEKCQLYSLLDGDKMVSHITVSIFDAVIFGEKKTLVQLGTVMTDDAYRGQGLNRYLMEKVLEEWDSKCDFIYLFANESVLDFYPKFGFSAVEEFEAVRTSFKETTKIPFRQLDIEEPVDLSLLDEITKKAHPLADLSIVKNTGLVMFYCLGLGLFTENLFYFESLNTIVVAEYDDENLIIYDAFAPNSVDLDIIVDSLKRDNTTAVTLRFTPQNKTNYQLKSFKDEDLVLFVSTRAEGLFENNRLIFPTLSHT